MTRAFVNTGWMKHVLRIVLAACTVPMAWGAQLGIYQHGTVVRMRMGDCALSHRGFMATFAGPAQAAQMAVELCPEYTLVSEKVVYVIVGRSSTQLIPLADVIDFRLHNNELVVRIDDARHESKFAIKEMILRSEWELVQKHITDELSTPTHATDSALVTRNQK